MAGVPIVAADLAVLREVLSTGREEPVGFVDPTHPEALAAAIEKQRAWKRSSEAIRKFASSGGSVLFYSSELPELVNLADRCIVLYGGRIFAEYRGHAIQEQALVGALIGHAQGAAA